MAERAERPEANDFIRERVIEDLETGRLRQVVTRFPPEPNGYLHIGHAKSICLNFGLAREFGGRCHLRFDDTNPIKEEQEYVDSILEDVRWLGFDWGEHLYYASDYFEKIYELGETLIRKGHAYVDELTAEEIREHRGTLTEPGRESPHRERPAEESLDLFRRMRAGEFPDGSKVLRAKIDMASPNINLRDPVLYRIRRAHHHRTGDDWCIYPMYDMAHGYSDWIEGITHSICTLEFEAHRPLYDWLLVMVDAENRPQQIEFARLNLTYTVLSKRKLLTLVHEKHVTSWDDPRMPTLSGYRRRGYTPESIRAFCDRVGVAKRDSRVDVTLLENALRDDLNRRAPRAMAVLRPLKLVLVDYPEGKVEWVESKNNPEDPSAGTRRVPFSRELWIERDDFREFPPKGFHRLFPGNEIRLRNAYVVKCVEVVKDGAGEVVEVRCTHDPETLGRNPADGRRIKGVSHWVSAAHAVDAEVRLYDRLFTVENPDDVPEGKDWRDLLNPASLEVLSGCKLEPSLAEAAPNATWQFERQGYFCADSRDSKPGRPVFNRAVTLRDTWAKLEKRGQIT
jgi:glutaminyl-tRNA synthetase